MDIKAEKNKVISLFKDGIKPEEINKYSPLTLKSINRIVKKIPKNKEKKSIFSNIEATTTILSLFETEKSKLEVSKPKIWTDKEIKSLIKYYTKHDYTILEISKILNKTLGATKNKIKLLRKKEGLIKYKKTKSYKTKIPKKELDNEIKELVHKGLSDSEIATILNTNNSRVYSTTSKVRTKLSDILIKKETGDIIITKGEFNGTKGKLVEKGKLISIIEVNIFGRKVIINVNNSDYKNIK